MRLRNPFLKTEYQLQEPLGEGLTSRVYKAIRSHRRLNLEQTVVLKILHSQKEVRTLKNEIKILSKVRSPHCVQLLGWEDLAMGPALVLEYLEGVSLLELFIFSPLSTALIEEIVAQVQDGLRDLRKYKIWHGDLSARNIFITSEGVVKLLDFGFSGNGGETTYGTSQFLSPEVWLGQPTSFYSDLFSLGLLREDLQGTLISDKNLAFWKQRALEQIGKNSLLRADPLQRDFLELESQKSRREELGAMALRALDYKRATPTTQRIENSPSKPQGFRFFRLAYALCAGSLLFCHPLQTALPALGDQASMQEKVVFSHLRLDVRSLRWAKVRLYKKTSHNTLTPVLHGNSVYTPHSFRNLPGGEYEIHWQSPRGEGFVPVTLKKNQRVILR